jgi:sugar phosphate isomerase/epimerase
LFPGRGVRSALSDGVEAGIRIAEKLGADLTKLSLDIRRPRPLYGSCFHPGDAAAVRLFTMRLLALPLLERTGIRLALENHTETFADEILWLIDKINHPLVGCLRRYGELHGGPRKSGNRRQKARTLCVCNHFCDHKLDRDQFGIRFHGVALGDGDIDCFKTYRTIRELSPTDRITFEIEWDMGEDSLEVAREKEMDACIRSIKYAREVLKIGS